MAMKPLKFKPSVQFFHAFQIKTTYHQINGALLFILRNQGSNISSYIFKMAIQFRLERI